MPWGALRDVSRQLLLPLHPIFRNANLNSTLPNKIVGILFHRSNQNQELRNSSSTGMDENQQLKVINVQKDTGPWWNVCCLRILNMYSITISFNNTWGQNTSILWKKQQASLRFCIWYSLEGYSMMLFLYAQYHTSAVNYYPRLIILLTEHAPWGDIDSHSTYTDPNVRNKMSHIE